MGKSNIDHVEDFVRRWLTVKPEANKDVLGFIGNIMYSQGYNEANVLANLFGSGYCYYFACILREAFPGGEVSLAAPYGHVVYKLEGIPYDCDGVYQGEGYPIPISEAGDTLESFLHRGKDGVLREAFDKYAKEHNMSSWKLARVVYDSLTEEEKYSYDDGNELWVYPTAYKYFRAYASEHP